MKKIICAILVGLLTIATCAIFYQNQKFSDKNNKYKELYEITKLVREGQDKIEEMRSPVHFYVHTESDFYLESLNVKNTEFEGVLENIEKKFEGKEKYKERLLKLREDYKILQSDLEDLKESEQKKITINLVDTSISLVCSDFRSILNWIETDAGMEAIE